MAGLSVDLAKIIYLMTFNLYSNTKLVASFFAAALLLGALLVPQYVAHADDDNDQYADYSATQLRDLISDLQSRLKDLQSGSVSSRVQSSSFQRLGSSNSFGSNVSSWFKNYSTFNRNLSRGNRDDDSDGEVSRLQWCLSQTGDYDYDEITGYYGEATERAVQKFQSRFKIVSSGNAISTGFGRVGPKTLTFINRYCKNIENIEVDELSMKVSVDGSKATVIASIPHPTITDDSCSDLLVGTVEWGDGESTEIKRERCPINKYSHTVTHTYEDDGTYTIELTDVSDDAVSEEVEIPSDDDDDDSSSSLRWWYDKDQHKWRWGNSSDDDDDKCESDGEQYREGTRKDEIVVDGETMAIADGEYVCRNGEWKAEGGFPAVDDSDETNSSDDVEVTADLIDRSETEEENNADTEDDNEGEFTLEFEVTADGEDIYVPKDAGFDQSVGLVFSILDENGHKVTGGVSDRSYSSTADEETDSFLVEDGTTETFTLTVVYDPDEIGSYKVRLDRINYSFSDKDEGDYSVQVGRGVQTHLLQIGEATEDADADTSGSRSWWYDKSGGSWRWGFPHGSVLGVSTSASGTLEDLMEALAQLQTILDK